jgi:CxxC motif-containing protein
VSAETERITCILCPNGCRLVVHAPDAPDPKSIRVEGNLCPKGEDYALEEVLDPKRTLTTSVLVRGGTQPQASVKTTRPIPRAAIAPARQALRAVTIDAPAAVGEIVATDIAGTGVDVVVTRPVPRGD